LLINALRLQAHDQSADRTINRQDRVLHFLTARSMLMAGMIGGAVDRAHEANFFVLQQIEDRVGGFFRVVVTGR